MYFLFCQIDGLGSRLTDLVQRVLRRLECVVHCLEGDFNLPRAVFGSSLDGPENDFVEGGDLCLG